MKLNLIAGLSVGCLAATTGLASEPHVPLAWDGKTQLRAPAGAFSQAVLEIKGDGTVRQLRVSFRDGKASRAYVVLAGAPLPRLEAASACDLARDGARLAGKVVAPVLRGDDRAAAPLPGALTVAATVDKDMVTGTVEGTWGKASVKGTVAGWLRSDQELRKADPVAAEPGWPTWSGPNGDFSVADAKHVLVEDLFQAPLVWASEELIWGARGSPPEWQVGGYSSPIVGGGKVFLNQFEGSGEVKVDVADATAKGIRLPRGQSNPCISADDLVWCFDATTGQLLWQQRMVGASVNASGSKHVYDNKSGACHDGKVYMLGFTWRVYCLDAATGKLLWHANLGKAHEAAEKLKAEALVTKVWARLEQPGTCLDVAEGVPFGYDMAGNVLAFDAATGQTLWRVAGGNPTRWAHKGRQYIVASRGTFANDYVILDPKTGKEVLVFKAGPLIQRIVLPLSGDYLLSQEPGGAEGRGTGVILCSRLGLDKVTSVWTSKDVPRPGPDGAVTFARGHACYGAGPATGEAKQTFAWAVDLATGKVAGQTPFGMASGTTGVAVGDRVLLNNDMRHTATTVRMWRVDNFQALGRDALWSQWHFNSNGYDSCIMFPVADGRIFFRGMNALVCYDLRAKGGTP